GLRFIKGRLRRLTVPPQPDQLDLITVPINCCRHYCGYRYGSSAFNPYENYIVGLHRQCDVAALRADFDDYLRHFRPRTFGDLFGISFSNPIALWVYPWDESPDSHGGWWAKPEDVGDIMTQFCDEGIRRSHINDEYHWLERAY